MSKTAKMTHSLKMTLSLKSRGLVPTIQPELDFSLTYSFQEVVDNVELITYMKFQKTLKTRCKDMGKKLKKYPQNGFSSICDPKIFFKN